MRRSDETSIDMSWESGSESTWEDSMRVEHHRRLYAAQVTYMFQSTDTPYDLPTYNKSN